MKPFAALVFALACAPSQPGQETAPPIWFKSSDGRITLPSEAWGCRDQQLSSATLMVAGLQVEEGHHGGYAVCNDGSSSVAMGWMSVPLDLNLRAKLDADAVADLNPNEGTWSTGSTLSGHPAREEHRANPGMEGPNAVRRARFVLHGGKLYIAAIISEDPDGAEATALLDSVVFNDLSPAK